MSAQPSFFRRSTVSQLQADYDALVAINTAFFDIGSTQAPTGILMRDRVLLREPAGHRNAFLIPDGGAPFMTNHTFSGTLFHNGATRAFNGVNHHSLGNNQVAVYQQPWNRSPGTTAAFLEGLQVFEVVVNKTGFVPASNPGAPARMVGTVASVRNQQPSVNIGANQFVITATGNARSFLQAMSVGSTVEVRWQLGGGGAEFPSWDQIKDAVAGWNRLLVNGQIQSNSTAHWNNRHPRTVVGLDQSGQRMVFLMVEGRQTGRAAGLSLHAMAQYLAHLGAYQGLEFDGGGSSGIAARVDGENRLLSTPSDGSERFVPAGLGLMLNPEEPNAFFQNIRITPGGDSAVVTWETAEPARSRALFGSSGYDRESARFPRPSTRHTALLQDLETPGRTFIRLEAVTDSGTEISHGLEVRLGELIMDDPEATLTGSWNTGAFGTPWGESYRWTNTVSGNATHTATYRPGITVPGRYDIFVWYVPGGNRTTAARYEIRHANGTSNVTVNQRNNGHQWRPLASNLRFLPGADHYVRINNSDGTGGQALMADGVRWVLRQPDAPAEGEPPAWWTRHFFGDEQMAGSVDADGDGYTVWQEYLWGTDPSLPESRPEFSLERNRAGTFTLEFAPLLQGRTYIPQGRGSLTEGEWQSVPHLPMITPPEGGGILRIIQPGTGQYFYRLEVRP